MKIKKKFILAAAVGATALSVQALPTEWFKVTYDNTTSSNWKSKPDGCFGNFSAGGNYSANETGTRTSAVGNFDTTRLGKGLWGASVWNKDSFNPGTTFTIGLCFKAVADPNMIIFSLGSIDDTGKEILYVHSKSANEIGLSVVKNMAVLRSLTVPVADVTSYHAYLIRYNNNTVWVEVDGVPVGDTMRWTRVPSGSTASNYMQILGAYSFYDTKGNGKLSGYTPGCGKPNDPGNWKIPLPNHGNVVDDVRIWNSILSEADGLEYAALFGDSTESRTGTTLVIEKGCLHSSYPDFNGATLVRKTTAGKALFDAVGTFPALTIEGGEVSFWNGTNKTHNVTGALTLAGGTTLDLDVLSSGCDALNPGSLDLSGASASNPVLLKLRVADDVSAFQNRTLITCGLTAGDEAKFAVALTGRAATPTLAVSNGALVLSLAVKTKPEILFTYDTINSTTTWKTNKGTGSASCGGNYSANETGTRTSAIANFAKGKSGYAFWGASPWYGDHVKLGTTFTISLCFKTVTTPGYIMFNEGGFAGSGTAKLLLVHSNDANSIKLSVLNATPSYGVTSSLVVPVDDPTQYHTYVIRNNNGTASVKVDGVPVNGTLTWNHTSNYMQILGAYSQPSSLQGTYPQGCGPANSNWVVTNPISGNVMDDVRIWKTANPATDGQLLDYYRDFGVIDWYKNGTTLIVREGRFVEGDYIFSTASGFTGITKLTDGTLQIGSETSAFTKPVVVSKGVLSFADGAARTTTFTGLTLAGGAHLAVDVVAATADCLSPSTLTLTDASAANPIVFDLNAAANANFNAALTLISSGLQPGDEAKFAYTGYTGAEPNKLVFVVSNGALKIRYNRGLKIFIR